MPTGLEQATNGDNPSSSGGQPGENQDIGNNSQTGGGTTVITQGGGPSTGYSYDVINIYGGIGSAYLALNNSNMTCNSSVGVFNRNNTFAAINTSTGNFFNCCSYAAHQGFIAYDSSKVATYICTATLSASNYRCIAASSLYCNLSASVFPILYGTYVSNTSSFISNEFETMTAIFASNAPAPTHFRSGQNSFCTNNTNSLTSKNSAGLSGPVVSGKNISFIWSQVWRHPTTNAGFPITNQSGLSISPYNTPASASYRYVPMVHSVDYYQVPTTASGNGTVISAGGVDTAAIVSIYAQGRNCYTSVKSSPDNYMFKPEDGSGAIANTALQGSFSVVDLIATLT